MLVSIGLSLASKHEYLIVVSPLLSITFLAAILLLSHFAYATPAVRSKHSAEHIMINFMETNQRLPKDIEEVKQYSRLSPSCSSLRLAKLIIIYLTSIIFALLFAFLVKLFSDNILFSYATFVVFSFFSFLILNGNDNYKVFSKITNKLNYFIQYTNTAKKVKDRDLYLAYSVAKSWVKIVCPEYYRPEDNDNNFCKQYKVDVTKIEWLL